MKGETKKFKKYLIGKLFREDVARMTKARKNELTNTFAKYKLRKFPEESKESVEVDPVALWQ